MFFDDPSGRVRLADMTGDGLNDIVQIHGGRIDYWPNLGYGRFGRRISMANAPLLDGDVDPRRLFLADLDGTGCADLVYVEARRVHFWFNRSGNAWSERQTITGTPSTDDATALEFADVFGTGTATLVWSRDFTGSGTSNYQVLDFCGGVKPYVLVGMDNSMGATTRVTYAPSTRYFLQDRAAGEPWLTPLPFPVQVVDKVETIDHVGRTKRVATYRYHHGHYDGREREFCGFGRVDQFDTESFEDFSQTDPSGDAPPVTNGDRAHYVPPVETRSWFHTGVYFDEAGGGRGATPLDYRDLTARFRQEYYSADDRAVPLDEHDVETGETPAEAYRALRGAQLRTELYAHDGSERSDHPYQVSESRYRVAQLQPRSADHHAVHFSHQVETLTYHYERNPADPRISHGLTLAVDAFGNPLKTMSVAYGRRQPDQSLPTQADRDRQARTLVTFTEARFTNAIDDPACGCVSGTRTLRDAHPRADRLRTACARCPTLHLRRMGGRRLRADRGRAGHRLRGGSRSGRPAEAPDRADEDRLPRGRPDRPPAARRSRAAGVAWGEPPAGVHRRPADAHLRRSRRRLDLGRVRLRPR